MRETAIEFQFLGLTLRGRLGVPEGFDGRPRPAIIVLHGFGSTMEADNVGMPVAMFSDLGYVTLRFDMPGCGTSEGERGRLICLEQVDAAGRALELLQTRPEVLADRVAIMGSSFGAAVAVYAAGVNPKFAAVISASGWGHGERKFRGQHNSDESYRTFLAMLEEGRAHRARTGQSLMVSRYDIVPVPEHLRGHLAARSIQTFPAETAQSMFDFRAEDVVDRIAPRPIIFLHSASDSVTPVEQSMSMWTRAGQPAELHLFADTDHFMFAETNPRPRRVVADWLSRYFPATVD